MITGLRGGWAENANADNAEAIATRAGVVGLKCVATHVICTYQVASDTGIMEIKIGGVIRVTHFVRGTLRLKLDWGEIAGEDGESISVELDASGTATQLGYVTLVGGIA